MNLKLEFCRFSCETKIFSINDIKADYKDFVDKYDHNILKEKETMEGDCCGNMSCDILESKEKILNKYKITKEDYYEIAENLYKGLSFGHCHLCF
jgi:hypothetical protein